MEMTELGSYDVVGVIRLNTSAAIKREPHLQPSCTQTSCSSFYDHILVTDIEMHLARNPDDVPSTRGDTSGMQPELRYCKNPADLVEKLQAATESIRQHGSASYGLVTVMLVAFEEHDGRASPCDEQDLEELGHIFRDLYGFDTDIFIIPRENAGIAMDMRLFSSQMHPEEAPQLQIVVFVGFVWSKDNGDTTMTAR
jgi:hypothetical protein